MVKEIWFPNFPGSEKIRISSYLMCIYLGSKGKKTWGGAMPWIVWHEMPLFQDIFSAMPQTLWGVERQTSSEGHFGA